MQNLGQVGHFQKGHTYMYGRFWLLMQAAQSLCVYRDFTRAAVAHNSGQGRPCSNLCKCSTSKFGIFIAKKVW